MSRATARDDRATPLRGPTVGRRRPRRWRALLSLITAGLKAAVLVGMPLAVAGWVASSPTFAVDDIGIVGHDRVPEPWLRATLAPLEGRHILGVSLAAVPRRLADHPWVAEVELTKRLPDRIEVRVLERHPVAVLLRDDGSHYVDAEGRSIAPVPSGRDDDLLEVVWTREAPVPVGDATAVVETLERLRPAWEGRLDPIELLGSGDCRVTGDALPFDLVVRRGGVEAALERLELVVERLDDPDAVAWIDLRLSDRAIVHPRATTETSQRDRTGSTER